MFHWKREMFINIATGSNSPPLFSFVRRRRKIKLKKAYYILYDFVKFYKPIFYC